MLLTDYWANLVWEGRELAAECHTLSFRSRGCGAVDMVAE
jgi:hypothetical protein